MNIFSNSFWTLNGFNPLDWFLMTMKRFIQVYEINLTHPTIKFTYKYNVATRSVNFLDTTVTITCTGITTTLFRKPTDRVQFWSFGFYLFGYPILVLCTFLEFSKKSKIGSKLQKFFVGRIKPCFILYLRCFLNLLDIYY